LEAIGFKGIDINIEKSLYCYGMVRKDDIVIVYNEEKDFNYKDITINDVKDALEEMDDHFYDYLGTTKDEYNNTYYKNITHIIYDIINYKNYLTEDLYYKRWYTIDEMIQFINNNYINTFIKLLSDTDKNKILQYMNKVSK